jgi:hypothetical protein
VALVDRDPAVEDVAKQLGPQARALVADVTRSAEVDVAGGAPVGRPAGRRGEQRRHHGPLVSHLGAERRRLGAGARGLTKALAKEVATQGILVHAVAPAVIGTELLQQMTKETVDMLVAKIPMGRVGTPAEVAALVAWLASDECTFTTGAVHDLSGGRASY